MKGRRASSPVAWRSSTPGVIHDGVVLEKNSQRVRQLADGDFDELPVMFEHAEALARLPAHHNDPFGRLILAVSLVEGLTIVSSDGQFGPYGLPLIDARK